MRHALTDKSRFVWLQPPASLGDSTVVDVVNLTGPVEYEAMVKY